MGDLSLRKTPYWLLAVFLTIGLTAILAWGQIPGLRLCCLFIKGKLKANAVLTKVDIVQKLAPIREVQNRIKSFEDNIWPDISQVRQQLAQLVGLVDEIKSVAATTVQSATQLKAAALEASLNSLPAPGELDARFEELFGPLPPVDAAAPAMRVLLDARDAAAKGAMKAVARANRKVEIQLDAVGKLEDRLKTMTAGTAPMVEAQAMAWLVRSNGHLQESLTELARLEAFSAAAGLSEVKSVADKALSFDVEMRKLVEP